MAESRPSLQQAALEQERQQMREQQVEQQGGGEESELQRVQQQTQGRGGRGEVFEQDEGQHDEGRKEEIEQRLQGERLRGERHRRQSNKVERQQENRDGALRRKKEDINRQRSFRMKAKETLEKHLGSMQVVTPIDPFPTAPRRETEVVVLEELPPDLTEKVAAKLSKQRKKNMQKRMFSHARSSHVKASPTPPAATAASAPGSAVAAVAAARGGREGGKQARTKNDDAGGRGENVEEGKKVMKGRKEGRGDGLNASLQSSVPSSRRLSYEAVERPRGASDTAADVSAAAGGRPLELEGLQQLPGLEKKNAEPQQRQEKVLRDVVAAVKAKLQPATAASAKRDAEELCGAPAGGEGGAREDGAAAEGRATAGEHEALRGGREAVAGRGETREAERTRLLLPRGGLEGSVGGPAEESRQRFSQKNALQEQAQQQGQQKEAQQRTQEESSLHRDVWPHRYPCKREAASGGGSAAAAAGPCVQRRGDEKTVGAVDGGGGGAVWNSLALEEGRRSSFFVRREVEDAEGKQEKKTCIRWCSFLPSFLFLGKRGKGRKDESFYLTPAGDTCSVCTRRSRFSLFSRDDRLPVCSGGGVAGAGVCRCCSESGGEKRRSGSSFYFMNRLFPVAGSEYSAPPMMAARLQATPFGVNRFVLLGIYVLYALLTGRVYFAWPNISNLLFRSEAYLWLCEDDTGLLKQPDLRLPAHGSRRYACEEQNARVQQLFVVCLASAYACALLAGLLLDKVGPKLTALFGQCCNCAAWLLLACASRTSQTYFPAFVVMGIGVDSGYMALLSVANLFPGHEG